MQLQNFNAQEFLQTYWQRQPLVIRQALPHFQVPLDADELAGLAMEPEVESRLVTTAPDWPLRHGPFAEQDFAGEGSWTLLVQAVDHYVPEVAELLRLIRFLPSWRVDDVMMSYANDGASVGPHYDNYDVFLLQGEGQREWLLGQQCDANTPLLPHTELRILKEFEQSAAYLLEPGDILYVPPGLAHWGIARGECTTFSLGLRAPQLAELMSRQVDQALEALKPELFYRDAQLAVDPLPGEITTAALEQARAQLSQLLQTGSSDARWLGELVTEPRYESEPVQPLPDQTEFVEPTLHVTAGARLAWSQTIGDLLIFANGQTIPASSASKELIISLCGAHKILPAELELLRQLPQNQRLITELLHTGCVYYE
ncbi:cupin domain-containing protein [Halieaceae bacterium IMCC14734]|uniref:Cupin domain-containing protein n=1 Tax=Candidatus Litorirhabdus singularis TaxID=2518993 RepID=A0ABT3TG19_9GAMM|nr:cupin domain-containing protein [Candidatus Litorirhabdus singularis]MCX2981228.1 cupin domain-containing protein [Candidatus Litorirhabdus singularis]